MANSVTIRTTAPGAKQAASDIKGLKGSIQSLGSRTGGPLGGAIGGLAGLGGGLATAGIVGGLAFDAMRRLNDMLVQGVSSALAEEQSLKRLDAALEANIKGWDGNRNAIDTAIDARMDLGFTDDDLRESMIRLVTATRDEKRALDLQSLAMDLARARGISLKDATDKLIKAGAGNTRVLKELGIEIDKGASKAEIYGAIQERVAGQTEAFMNTTVGKLTVADTKVGELQESMGNLLLPMIGNVATAASSAADQIENMFSPPATMDLSVGKEIAELDKNIGGLSDTIESAVPDVHNAARALNRAVIEGIDDLPDKAGEIGSQIPEDLAEGVRGSKDTVANIMDDLTFAIENPLAQTREMARIEGLLMGDKLGNALRSKNPFIRQVASQTQTDLIAQWESISGKAWTWGGNAGENYTDNLENKIDDAAEIARRIRERIRAILSRPLSINAKINLYNRLTNSGNIPGFAEGGFLPAGKVGIVGEEGPELIEGGSAGSRITPLGGGSGGSMQVVVMLTNREVSASQQHYRLMQAGRSNF
jgi:hypothetical protein